MLHQQMPHLANGDPREGFKGPGPTFLDVKNAIAL